MGAGFEDLEAVGGVGWGWGGPGGWGVVERWGLDGGGFWFFFFWC